jgi:saccharopine dehydrogenase-like NADP-dependent oxidoreductase
MTSNDFWGTKVGTLHYAPGVGLALDVRRNMKDVVVIGAGKIGATAARALASTGDYQVTLADRSPEVLDRFGRNDRISITAVDVEDSAKLLDLVNGSFAVLNAAPFRLTMPIAEAARAARTHYLDLTEDIEHAPREGARDRCKHGILPTMRACSGLRIHCGI